MADFGFDKMMLVSVQRTDRVNDPCGVYCNIGLSESTGFNVQKSHSQR